MSLTKKKTIILLLSIFLLTSLTLATNSEIESSDDFSGFGAVSQGLSPDGRADSLLLGYGFGENNEGITYDLFETPYLQYQLGDSFNNVDLEDKSGNNRDATSEGSVSSTSSIWGKTGVETSTSSFIDTNTEAPSGDTTITFWGSFDGDTTNTQGIVSDRVSDPYSFYLSHQSGSPYYRFDAGDSSDSIGLDDYIDDNTWHHISLVHNSASSGGYWDIYVDGQNVETYSATEDLDSFKDEDIHFGGLHPDRSSGSLIDSEFEGFMVFDSALSSNQIQSLYMDEGMDTGSVFSGGETGLSFPDGTPYYNAGTHSSSYDETNWDTAEISGITDTGSQSVYAEFHGDDLGSNSGYVYQELDISGNEDTVDISSIEETSEIQVFIGGTTSNLEDPAGIGGIEISYSEATSEPPEVAVNSPADGSTFEYEWDEDGVNVDLEGQVSPADESGTLSLELDGTEIATTSFSSDTFESLQTTENLDEGSYNLEVIADTQDHTVTDDVSFSVEQNDAEVPDVNMNLPQSGESFFYGFNEDNTEVELQGSISSEDVDGTGRLYLNDEVVETNEFQSGQVTEVQTFEDLDEGTYEVYTEAETELGDTYTSTINTFDVVQEDADEPTVAVNSPADGSTITYDFQEDNTDVEIEGQVSPADESGTLEVELDGTVIATESFPDDTLTSASSTETLDEGNYEVTVRAETDTYTVTESITFDVVQSDAEAPEVNLLEPEDGSTIEYLETADGTDIFHEFEVLAGDEDGTAELVVDGTVEQSFSFTGLDTETFGHDVFQDVGTYEWFVDIQTEEFESIESETFTYSVEETDALSPVINTLDLTSQEEIGMNEDFTLSFDVEDPNEEGLDQVNADLMRVIEDEENEPIVNSGIFDIEGTSLEDEISREDFKDNLAEDDDELFEEIGDYKIEFYVENDAGLSETQEVEFEVLSEAESGLTGALISLTQSIVDAVGDFSDNVPNVVKYFISIAIGIAIGIQFRDSQHLAVLGMSSFFLLMAIVGWLPTLLITGLIAVAIILVGYSVFIRGAD